MPTLGLTPAPESFEDFRIWVDRNLRNLEDIFTLGEVFPTIETLHVTNDGPDKYPRGISVMEGTDEQGWSTDEIIITFKVAEGKVIQFANIASVDVNGPSLWYRQAKSATLWDSYLQLMGFPWMVLMKRTSSQLINNTTDTGIDWQSGIGETESDETPMWVSGTPKRLICRRSGLYQVSLSVRWAASASSAEKTCFIRKNGLYQYAGDSSGFPYISCHALVDMIVGDYLEGMVWQNTGAGLNVVTWGTYGTSMSAVLHPGDRGV